MADSKITIQDPRQPRETQGTRHTNDAHSATRKTRDPNQPTRTIQNPSQPNKSVPFSSTVCTTVQLAHAPLHQEVVGLGLFSPHQEGDGAVERRHLVAEPLQLHHRPGRQDVGADRKGLSQLDVERTQRSDDVAQLDRPRDLRRACMMRGFEAGRSRGVSTATLSRYVLDPQTTFAGGQGARFQRR